MGLAVLLAAMSRPVEVHAGSCTPTVNIDVEPGVQTACQGETATFTVSASSTAGLPSFQWQVSTNNGASFNNVTTGTGATASSYTTAALTLSESGNQYRVIVDDATQCAVTSAAVGLTVNPLPLATPFVIAANSTICAGESTNITLLGPQVGVNYQLRNSLGNTPVGSPVAGVGGAINLPTGPVLVTTQFNILATFVATGCSQQLNNTQVITVNPLPDATLAVSATSAAICSGTSTEVTVAQSEVGVTYQLRNNSGNTSVGVPVAGTGGQIELSTGILNATTTFNVFATVNATGCSQQLTATQTVTVTSLPDAGLAVGATNSTVCRGNSSNVTVVGSVVGVTCQLRNNSDDSNVGSAVAGTGGTIELSTGVLTSTTTFNVLATVTGSTCSVQLSATQTITVADPPDNTLAVDAVNSIVCAGASTQITVAGSVIGVSYQLRNNANNALIGSAVAGTGGTINLPTGAITLATAFNVLATTDATGCVAELTDRHSVLIQPSVAFKTQPSGRTICAGAEAEFSAEVEGLDLSLQWQISTDGGATFQDLDGATAATYKTGATKEGDNGNQYRLSAKDPCGTHFSAAALLIVNKAPSITKQPDDAAIDAGKTGAFAVVAEGSGSLSYSWEFSKDNGATFQAVASGTGAGSATYVTDALAASDNGIQYRVIVSNACGTVVSKVVVTSVNSPPPAGQPNPLCSVCGIGCSFGSVGILGGLMSLRLIRSGSRTRRRYF